MTQAARDYVASHRQHEEASYFGITELAAESGLSARAIRFYEDKGLLKPRRINGGRAYTRRDCIRLALIQRGKAMGMSLAEVKHILDLYGERGQGKAAQTEYILARIDAAMGELEERREHIVRTLSEMKVIREEIVADAKRKRRAALA